MKSLKILFGTRWDITEAFLWIPSTDQGLWDVPFFWLWTVFEGPLLGPGPAKRPVWGSKRTKNASSRKHIFCFFGWAGERLKTPGIIPPFFAKMWIFLVIFLWIAIWMWWHKDHIFFFSFTTTLPGASLIPPPIYPPIQAPSLVDGLFFCECTLYGAYVECIPF